MASVLKVELTHVQLPDKTGHVVVFEVLGKHLLGKLALVKHMEAVSALEKKKKRNIINPVLLLQGQTCACEVGIGIGPIS